MSDERARRIDALVAEHVMGWEITHRGRRVRPGHDYGHNHREVTGFTGYTDARRWIATVCHEFSTTWEGMGLVVEKWAEEGRLWQAGYNGRCYYVELTKPGEKFQAYSMDGRTLPEAVALTALYSKGIGPVALKAKGIDVAALTGGET